MSSIFKLLPLELLDIICSYLRAEDVLTLRKIFPLVAHCPRYKRLVNKTRWFNRMWDKISYHREIHEDCIHVCLPEITMNPFNDYDEYLEHEDSFYCYFRGKGIFCYPMNELRGQDLSRYEKQIVPLKKHIHCNCDKNELIPCEVHEDDEKYEESISFAKRMWKNGGYDEIQSTPEIDEIVPRELTPDEIEQLSTMQTSESVSIELTQYEIEQLFEEF